MFAFSRTRRADPAHMRAAAGWATDMADCVRTETGRDVQVWSASMSPDYGQMVWLAMAEHVVEIETALDKLRTSFAYADLIDRGQGIFIGPVTDSLWSSLYGEPKWDGAEYLQTTQCTAVGGNLAGAGDAAVQVAKEFEKFTGRKTVVSAALTGNFGTFGFGTAYDSIDQFEKMTTKWMAAPDMTVAVDKCSMFFLPGVLQSIYRRIH